MTGTLTPRRPTVRTGRAGFGHLLHAEWTKFRTVRGWLVAIAAAALLMVLFGLLTSAGQSTHRAGPGASDHGDQSTPPTGPDGETVGDNPYFVHRSLDGDGSLTVRVTSLTATALSPDDSTPTPGLEPWTKAGILIKQDLRQGSAYAAIMVTGAHGVRMQYNYIHDIAGPTGTVSTTSPRWLRLTRTGDTITGYASTDGTDWSRVGSVHLAGLPATVPAGLFVASPGRQAFEQHLGGTSTTGFSTTATATLDKVDLAGGHSGDAWEGRVIGGDSGGGPGAAGTFRATGDVFTVSGSGDIAPAMPGPRAIERTLIGAFAALTVLVILGALFVTTEYRRGLIRTSLAASPRRGRVLAAKAIVIGTVTFVSGLAATAITLVISEAILRAKGNPSFPVTWPTELRIVVGTAALLALASVLAVATGTILRRGAGTVVAVLVATVLPYILAVSAVLPAGPAQWLLRLSPAAAFAIQQSVPAYPQVDQAYTPAFGFYPLAPWAGLAVLCGWTALALALGGYLLRRRDA